MPKKLENDPSIVRRIPDEERLIGRSIRLTRKQWERYDAAGGSPWLRRTLQRLKVDKPTTDAG